MNVSEEIHKMRENGFVFKAIGKRFNRTGEWARQIEAKHSMPLLRKETVYFYYPCAECNVELKAYENAKAKRKFCSKDCLEKFINNRVENAMPQCSNCGTVKNLSANGKYFLKSGAISKQYLCRECNTERLKKYRQTKNGKIAVDKARRMSQERYPEKYKARTLLNVALKKGTIARPKACTLCLISKPEAHHEDYTKPLEVHWLCRQCHVGVHNGTIKNNASVI